MCILARKEQLFPQRELKREEKSSFCIQGRAHYLAAYKFLLLLESQTVQA